MEEHKLNKLLLTLGMLLLTIPGFSQRIWSNVTLNRTSAYVGQPVEVTIEVFTSTWFTSGIDPGNIQVEGAFTVYFRPVSQSIRVEGNTYAGVKLIYQVFPYSNESLVFPSLKLTVESPPEGQYKGVERVLTTEEKVITVIPIPADFDGDQWLVATGLSVNDRWSDNTIEIKVGDVLTRTIARTANGTVSELIPPFEYDSIAGVSQYPSRSQVQNHKTKTSIYATRTETMRYLFTEEGKIIIPAKTVYWFHPYREKLYKRTLPEREFTVMPNPDLGIMASIRDSLDATLPTEIVEQPASEKKEILGLSLPQFIALALVLLLVAWKLAVWLGRLITYFKQRRSRYLYSEKYYFRQFLKAIRSKQLKSIHNALYQWLDHLNLKEPSAKFFSDQLGMAEIENEVQKLHQNLADNKTNLDLKPSVWTKGRKLFFANSSGNLPKNDWINP